MKKRLTLTIVLLVLVAVTAVFVGRTYARYVSEGTASGKVTVAKWAMKLNATDITPAGSTSAGEITLTAATTTDVVTGKIAPGVNATGVVSLDPNGTEVSFKYIIAAGTPTGADLPDNVTLKYYSCYGVLGTGSGECNATSDTGWTQLTGTTISGTRQLASNAAWDSTGLVNIKIVAEWPWGDTANNVSDTSAGAAATGTAVTIPFTVTVKQYLTGQTD